jgi:thiamine pyrophosphate-dependent acetolactate synthase large subunit-like protein
LQTAKNLLKLVETTRTPIFGSTKFSGTLPHSHPLRASLAGRLGILPATGQKAPDLIILLGARTGFLLGGRNGSVIPNKDCKLVQVDVDGSEIGRSHPIDVGIVSSVSAALGALNTEVEKKPFKAPESWVKTAMSLKDMKSECEGQDTIVKGDGRLHPYHAVKKVFTSLKPGAIIIMDGGEAGGWSAQNLEFAEPSLAIVSTGYLGFLGNGWGYSLGAAIAAPDKQVLNMHGDGSAGFHIAELDTFKRFNLNILTVVINNYGWGMSRNGQELVFGEGASRPASKLSPSARYDIVGQGFGCEGAMVEKLEDIEGAVKKMTGGKGPGCLNVIVADHPIHSSTRSMVQMSKDPNVIVVPYYDNLPRPFYKD